MQGSSMTTLPAANPLPDEVEGGFDYATLEPPIAEAAMEGERAIRTNLRHIREAIFEVGRQLVHIRDALMPNQFCAWVPRACGISISSADRFMAVYERLGGDEFRSLRNCALAATTLYKLAER